MGAIDLPTLVIVLAAGLLLGLQGVFGWDLGTMFGPYTLACLPRRRRKRAVAVYPAAARDFVRRRLVGRRIDRDQGDIGAVARTVATFMRARIVAKFHRRR